MNEINLEKELLSWKEKERIVSAKTSASSSNSNLDSSCWSILPEFSPTKTRSGFSTDSV